MIIRVELQAIDRQSVVLPRTGKVLAMQVARNAPCLFVLDDGSDKETREIVMHMTGHSHMEVKGTYLGTFQINNGEMSLHVFDEGPTREKLV